MSYFNVNTMTAGSLESSVHSIYTGNNLDFKNCIAVIAIQIRDCIAVSKW